MNCSDEFKIGDWVTYLPEPEKSFEIVATSNTPYRIGDGNYPDNFSPDFGFDFLLKRGTWGDETFNGFEPYKSARKSELRLKQ